MADKKISELTDYTPPIATDALPVLDLTTGITKKISYSNLHPIKFGGTGADGALTVSSGNTAIDLGGAQVVTKNYTSISITGTGKISFTNPHANGTIIILKSQGNVTLTSSSTSMIDASNCGGAGGTGATSNYSAGTAGTAGYASSSAYLSATAATGGGLGYEGNAFAGCGSGGGGVTTAGENGNFYANPAGAAMSITLPNPSGSLLYRNIVVATGGGGGGGARYESNNGGNGGTGGGCVIIECGGYWNFTTTNCTFITGGKGQDVPYSPNAYWGPGAGGGSGMFVAWYNKLTANTGTILYAGGAGGVSPGTSMYGGAGGAGFVSITENVSFF
jgi:hypothetical protein